MGGIVYATLATSGRAMGDAAAALHRALGKDTTRPEAHFLLGVAYEQLGRTEEAIRALEQSVRIDSNRVEPLRALAHAYDRAGRSPAAIDQLYQRALALQPALAWMRAEYADFLQAQGRRDEAERAYRSALAEQPGLAVAWFNLGTLLAEADRRSESSNAFQEAVHLDPMLAQALSPLLQIRTMGKVVTGASSLGSPLPSLLVRERGPRAVELTVATGGGSPGLTFRNVPPRGVVQILKPDGTLVRALPTGEGGTLSWNLLTETGSPIGGGLYRARVLGRDAAGRPLPPQILSFGVVRQRVE
jgi:tetratricopeptide (TPR) repeat protein